MLVFIPAVGEFVIPDLLGGSQTLMIGKTLWNEFFSNRDWPVSSAVAVILLLLLIVPIMIFQKCAGARAGAGPMNTSWTRFNITSIVLGFAFLYLPIVLLVIFSFNESKLVTVWGGFSTKWYASLFNNQGLMDAAWVTARVARHLRDRRDRARHAGRADADALHALSRPHAVFRHGLCAAGHAGSHHRPVAAAALRRHRLRPRLPDGDASRTSPSRMCFVAVVVQSRLVTFDRSLEEAAMDLGAPPVTTFFQITLPVILPAIVSGWMLAFTLSLDDLVIASFTSGPGATTLPMKIYSQVRLGVTPEINAACTLLIAVVAVGVILASRRQQAPRSSAPARRTGRAARLRHADRRRRIGPARTYSSGGSVSVGAMKGAFQEPPTKKSASVGSRHRT